MFFCGIFFEGVLEKNEDCNVPAALSTKPPAGRPQPLPDLCVLLLVSPLIGGSGGRQP